METSQQHTRYGRDVLTAGEKVEERGGENLGEGEEMESTLGPGVKGRKQSNKQRYESFRDSKFFCRLPKNRI